MSPSEQKRAAAYAALDELPDEGIVGIGTGSTASYFIEGMAHLVRKGRKLVGVPTSFASRKLAEKEGIPLLSDEGPWQIDVTVDGADEVDRELNLIKGGGGAHTREKIVNFASKKNVIIVDASKLSAYLGERWSIPIEILPFAHKTVADQLSLYGKVALREDRGTPARTDSGNYIYDLQTGPLVSSDRLIQLERSLQAIPGVVETGLFLGRTDVLLVADSDGVRRESRPRSMPQPMVNY